MKLRIYGALFTGAIGIAAAASAAITCPTGQVALDGTSCVTLTAWPNQTDIPNGSKVVIRLRKVMTDYQGNSVAWPKYVGISTKDNQTIDAVDVNLFSRDVFTVQVFHPAGQKYYDLPWYCLQASTGKYVAGTNDGKGGMIAKYDLPNAGLFARGWDATQAANFLIEAYPWSKAQYWLDQVKSAGNYYVLCQSPFTLGSQSIIGWYCGPAPNYGCYGSAAVDFFTVK